jgi:hypothetical protein
MSNHVRFHFLTGDVNFTQHGGKWLSNKLNNSEFDYYLVIELMNWHELGYEEQPRYNVCLSAVSPQQAGEEHLQRAYDCVGLTPDMLESLKASGNLAEAQVEALHSYGGVAPVWQADGDNWKSLMQQARAEAQCCEGLLGFYLDRPVNRIGETGWEALRMADTREVLDRVLGETIQ